MSRLSDDYTPSSGSGAYAPAARSKNPMYVAWIGDSRQANNMKSPGNVAIVKGNNWLGAGQPDVTHAYQPAMQGVLTWACILSGGRMVEVYNGAVSGATTADMIGTYLPALLALAGYDYVFLGDARNDFAAGTSEATARGNIDSMVQMIRAAGKTPILYTILPDNVYTTQCRRHNYWLRRYAAAKGILLVDPYSAAVDITSTTGAWTAAMTADGTHPTMIAAATIGQKVVDDLAGILEGNVNPMRSSFLPQDRAGAPNLLLNPLFQDDGNADGIADNWSLTQTGTAHTIVTDAGVIGKAQQLVVSTGTVVYQQTVTVDGTNVSVGDRVGWAGMIKTANAAAGAMNYQAVFSQISAAYVVQAHGQTVGIDLAGWTPFYAEMVVQPGATQIRARYQVDAGTGTLLIAQNRVFNATTLGGP